jgi:hypothetical protein
LNRSKSAFKVLISARIAARSWAGRMLVSYDRLRLYLNDIAGALWQAGFCPFRAAILLRSLPHGRDTTWIQIAYPFTSARTAERSWTIRRWPAPLILNLYVNLYDNIF